MWPMGLLFQTWILLKKEKIITYPSHTPNPSPPPNRQNFFFGWIWFLYKNIHFAYSLYKKISLILAATHPPKKNFTYASYFGYLFSLTLSMTSYYFEVTVTCISWSRDFEIHHIGHLSKQRAQQIVRGQPFFLNIWILCKIKIHLL